MAGGGSDEDNPVSMNVVALIDILLCLLLFYMCVSKFVENEGKLAAWLPRDKGANAGPVSNKPFEDIRINLSWENDETVRRFGETRRVETIEELETLITSEYARLSKGKIHKEELPPVILKVTNDVPYFEVVSVMDMLRRNEITKIEFAFTEDAAGKLLPQQQPK